MLGYSLDTVTTLKIETYIFYLINQSTFETETRATETLQKRLESPPRDRHFQNRDYIAVYAGEVLLQFSMI